MVEWANEREWESNEILIFVLLLRVMPRWHYLAELVCARTYREAKNKLSCILFTCLKPLGAVWWQMKKYGFRQG